jgi:hypothetical protein
MRIVFAGLALAAFAAPALAGGDCAKDVEAAFNKQRQSKAYRVVVTMPAQPDAPEDMFEYQPPLLMYRKLLTKTVPMPVETIGFGNRAWSREEGGWMEMQPQFANMTRAHLQEMFGQPVAITTPYACLGKATFEGKEYAAFRTAPERIETGETVARTIYVDPETGLPAYNVVGAVEGDKPLIIREAYDYPDDIKIEVPDGAPVMQDRH